MDKTKFLAKLAAVAALMVSLAKDMQEIDWQYWKMLYGSGPNAITDAEASAIGATAADVTAAITAIESLAAPLLAQSQIAAFFRIAR